MLDGIVGYVRNKPRTSALTGAAVVAAFGLLAWDASRGGALLAYLPLLLCFAMHGLMHGRHGGHGGDQNGEGALKEIMLEPNEERTSGHGHD
ncbi:DUF2933 domain-containing protein [Consotaella salsifontis]|uniref:DUF2933 domain-containing protein n=1 Tax=Consotaella salsifontis TaxID=1365950 RepID=A0A1T4RME7_9HYPH|nr:DUF2933 domain-containing protein [Consotaella salsifontis]SKA17139.1 Protein of unknown function [Consotaella salsifontis]